MEGRVRVTRRAMEIGMKRLGSCFVLLSLAACAAAPHAPAPSTAKAPTVTPVPATVAAPAAASVYAADGDTATPIPDLDEQNGADAGPDPDVAWGDVSIAPVQPQYNDLWSLLAQNFMLKGDGGELRVQGELQWFAAHGEYLNRVAGRARPYLYYIVQQVQARKMPLD